MSARSVIAAVMAEACADVEGLLWDVGAGVAHLAIAETPAATFLSWMELLSDDPRGN